MLFLMETILLCIPILKNNDELPNLSRITIKLKKVIDNIKLRKFAVFV